MHTRLLVELLLYKMIYFKYPCTKQKSLEEDESERGVSSKLGVYNNDCFKVHASVVYLDTMQSFGHSCTIHLLSTSEVLTPFQAQTCLYCRQKRHEVA